MNDMSEARLSQALSRKTKALPLELKPVRDLWPQIESEISNSDGHTGGYEVSSFERYYPLAAAMVLAILVTAGMNFWRGDIAPVRSHENLVVDQSSAPTLSGMNEFVDHNGSAGLVIDAGYRQTRNDLADSLIHRLENFSQEDLLIIRVNLAKIDDALAEINTALKSDPDNMLLQRLLMSAYSDDLALLGEIDAMTRSLDARFQL